VENGWECDDIMTATNQTPKAPSTRRHRRMVGLLVAAASTAMAMVLGIAQQRPLGDEPVAMIVCGGSLAALTGALRLGHPALLGLASMAGFPVWALIDLGWHGGHSLLPLEFAFYAAYAGLAIAVAAMARRFRGGT
jgi:hypothetical protein